MIFARLTRNYGMVKFLFAHYASNSGVVIHKSRRYTKFNLQYPDLSAGKKCQPLSEEIAQKVHDYLQRFKVGYQRMTSTLKRTGYSNVTEYQVRNLYKKEGYYLYEKKYRVFKKS